MNFKTFLLTETSMVHLDELEPEQLKWVRQFLSESRNFPLYRGAKGLGDYPMIVNRPVGRKPKDTDRVIHRVFDELLQHEVGFKGRSEAFFTTGSERIARAYGNPYYIIPCSDYKYAWFQSPGGACKDSADITLSALELVRHMADDGEVSVEDLLADHDSVWMCLEEAMHDQGLKLTSKDLLDAIDNDAEIMLSCDQALMIPATRPYKQVLGELK